MTSEVEIGTTRTGTTELRRHWRAENPWASLVIVHGLGEHCGRYERTGRIFAEAGIDCRSFDLVGFGASGGTRGHVEGWSVYMDQVLDNLAPAFNSGLPTVLMGHSFGGLVAATYALSLHRQPDLFVLSSPALDAEVPAWQRAGAPVMSRLLPKLAIPNPFKPEDLARDQEVGRAYVSDPLVVRKTTTRLGALSFEQMEKFQGALDAFTPKTYAFHGADDTIVHPRFSEIIAHLPNVEYKVYPDVLHETCNEPEGPEIVADIVEWISKSVD